MGKKITNRTGEQAALKN